ncbi:MAG TPA: 1,4-alpha-glucan branching enzyme, partial [Geodermatophilus sp.]|nr:1,4-alpha-glucan branching enzyme [Geodermatophilus sp.]
MTSPDETERTTDSPPTGGQAPATREELQAVVEERTAAAAAAEDGPIVNAAPARKRAAAKKAPAAKKAAPAKKATAAEGTAAKKTTARKTTAKKTAAGAAAPATKRAPRKKAAQADVVAEQGGTAEPAVAPAPIAEPGSPSGAPAGQPEPPSPDPAEPSTPQAPDEDGGTSTHATSTQATPTQTPPTQPAGDTTVGTGSEVAAATVPEGQEPAEEGLAHQEAPAEVGEEQLRAVVDGWSYAPHSVLGAHPAREGWVVRTLRPDAVSVTVVDEDGSRHEARPLHAGGVFEAHLAGQPGDYRLEVTYGDGADSTNTFVVDDPYRWLPTVGELDQHLIREGRHERLWEVLGSHVRRYDTPRGPVEGVSFAVWAPNAQGVRVTGDFDYWQARAYPMRSLGSSGVWEVFIPG